MLKSLKIALVVSNDLLAPSQVCNERSVLLHGPTTFCVKCSENVGFRQLCVCPACESFCCNHSCHASHILASKLALFNVASQAKVAPCVCLSFHVAGCFSNRQHKMTRILTSEAGTVQSISSVTEHGHLSSMEYMYIFFSLCGSPHPPIPSSLCPSSDLQSCGHRLCINCSRELCKLHLFQPALCPFCRGMIQGFCLA